MVGNTQSDVGIDVSKGTLDVCVLGDGYELFQVDNLQSGFTKIENQLNRYNS